MPCFAATYGVLNGLATSACVDAMLMIRPHLRCFMPGSASRIVWNDADRLSAMIWFHFATGKSSIGATCWMPALFTSTSTVPNASIARAIIASMAAASVKSAPS